MDDIAELRRRHDRNSTARDAANLVWIDVEQRDDVKSVAVESSIVGQGHAEVSGTDDDDGTRAVDAQRSRQYRLELGDVVADAARAELAETSQVLADLRGVEVKALRHLMRRHGALTDRFEVGEATEINRQAPGGQLGDRFAIRWRLAAH